MNKTMYVTYICIKIHNNMINMYAKCRLNPVLFADNIISANVNKVI